MHKKLWRMFALKRNSTLQIMDVQNNSLLWLLWIKNWNLLANWRSTLDLLKRKGWKILNKCYMCKEEEKTVEHILLQGSKAVILWQLIYALFGVQRVMHSLVKCAFWACELARDLCRREEKKGLESCSIMLVIDHFKREKQESFWKLWKNGSSN